MSRRELRLQKKIKRAIEDAGGAARIVVQTAYTTVGDPDLYACLNGHFLQIEVKDGWGYTVQPIQKRRLREWAGAGALAVVVRNMDDANFLIKQLTKVDLYGRPSHSHHRTPTQRQVATPEKSVLVRLRQARKPTRTHDGRRKNKGRN